MRSIIFIMHYNALYFNVNNVNNINNAEQNKYITLTIPSYLSLPARSYGIS